MAQFRSRRVVGAHSALLALRKTPELQLDPPTEALALHLPGQKQVFIQAGSGATSRQTAATNALNRAAARNSQLTDVCGWGKWGASSYFVSFSTNP